MISRVLISAHYTALCEGLLKLLSSTSEWKTDEVLQTSNIVTYVVKLQSVALSSQDRYDIEINCKYFAAGEIHAPWLESSSAKRMTKAWYNNSSGSGVYIESNTEISDAIILQQK
ncbi:hypothetical protein O6H91_10G047400 [Diphasiastrum complanatum]|uniref:Uncharacterized protein n=1 Tax=Diphasiastrum complanatum TaxID=34168 RepID=A0ACC2CHL4_DIPCM|nr:hypothetical protein O6H91_10G047400 [Diphasiastrum complanatum]